MRNAMSLGRGGAALVVALAASAASAAPATAGPEYLNVCVEYRCPVSYQQLPLEISPTAGSANRAACGAVGDQSQSSVWVCKTSGSQTFLVNVGVAWIETNHQGSCNGGTGFQYDAVTAVAPGGVVVHTEKAGAC
jgi:hypothetical protein